MGKLVLFTIVGLLVITQILARSTDKNNSCGKHGDSCVKGCCDGFTCNGAAGRCMATITADMLKEARSKLKPVNARPASTHNYNRNDAVDTPNCGKHGDDCSRGCCNGFNCNSAAGRCMAKITDDMLQEARKNLKPVGSRHAHELPKKQHNSNSNGNFAAVGA